MSAATEFAPAVCTPLTDPLADPFGAPARRHLRAVPAPGAAPLERPAGAAPRLAPVAVLHAPGHVAPAVAPLRLTRRGVVVLAALVAALAGALLWVAALSAPGDPAAGSAAPAPASVTVQPGDTLWSIAGRVAPSRDPRAEVDALRRANHLSGVELEVGQQLRIP